MDVRLDGGLVAAVEPAGTLPVEGARVVDGAGLLVLPGLVNAHTHSPENCLRGVGEGLALEPWLLRMFAAGGEFTPSEHYACALAGAVEMLRQGITSVVDHLWMTPPSVEAVDAVMRAYRDAGIRASVAPLMGDHDFGEELAAAHGFDLGDASLDAQLGFLPPAELVAILEESLRRWHGAENGRLRVLAGPSGVQWVTDELLCGLAAAARRHGSGIHVHLLETTLQDRICRQRFGASAVEGLDRLGVLGPDCSLPHSVWLDEAGIELVAARGAVVVHNPAANLRLGSGRAPVPELLRRGATVALGTDGSASSDNQSLWDCVKLAALVHNRDGWVSGGEAIEMATRGGAAVVGREGLGELRVGAPADVALVDLAGVGMAGAQALAPTLALSSCGRDVRHVFAAGRQVVADGRCTSVDEREALAALAACVSRRAPAVAVVPKRTRAAMRRVEDFRAVVGCAVPGHGGSAPAPTVQPQPVEE